MKILLVKYFCKKGMKDTFISAIKENKIDVLCQAENGNLQYEYSYHTENPDELILTEIWKDDEALKVHGQAEHFKLLQELKAKYVEETTIKKFDATEI